MIRASFNASLTATTGAGRRTITGVAVPWGEIGTVSDGTDVIFHPGSLDASARPPLLRDHRPDRPIGLVADAVDTPTGMVVTARVSAVAGGDEALILAADGVLGMFSVGVDPTDARPDQAGVLHVYAADWRELSLLTLGAFGGARVASVTATHEGGAMPDLNIAAPDDVEPDDDDAPVDDDQEELELVDAAPVVTAGRHPAARRPAAVPLRAGGGRPRPFNLAALAGVIAAGKRRGLQAAAITAQIQAALTNITTTDIAGIVQPAYRAELQPLIDHGMPLVRAIGSRPMPANGMKIEYPVWTAPPDAYAKQTAEKQPIATGPVTVDIESVDIETWAQGNDISFQALNRSDPSFIDAYLRAAALDAGRKYDTAVGTALLAVAAPATPGTTFIGNVKALFAALDPATTPPGPMFLAVSYDQTVELIDVPANDGPAFWSVSLSLGDFMPNVNAGLTVFADWNLPVGTMLLGSRAGAVSYGGPDTSADVRIVDVSLLGIDIGVYFYAALGIEYPGAFAKLTALGGVGGARATKATKS